MNSEPTNYSGAPVLTLLERLVVIVLRVIGGVDLLAVVAVLMPFRWSAEAHQAMGLGPLPELPVTLYLIRSASLLYAAHAAVLIYISRDVRRYSRLISFVGTLAMVQGTVLLFIDYSARLPKWWMVGEPACYWMMAAVLLLLQQRIRRVRAQSTQAALNRSA